MSITNASRTTILTAGSLLALLAPAAQSEDARVQGKLNAAYTITFAHIRVGDVAATVDFEDDEYMISASGHAGGIMRALVNGEASYTARGKVKDSRLVPTTFTSKIRTDTETSDVTMALNDGNVQELAVAPPSNGNVPLTEANRQGVVDPLSAMLFPAGVTSEGLSLEACDRSLPIFDGRHRYDLKLAFKRTDIAIAGKGYAGPVLVCSVVYEPIAGHRASTPLVKYLSGGREMEIVLAPVAGTRVLAPTGVSVISMLANIVIQADRFDSEVRPSGAPTIADPKAP